MHLTSCETLVNLITSIGEFLLYYCQFFLNFISLKKKSAVRFCFFFFLFSCVPYLYSRIACLVGLNCDQMEEEEHYSDYSVERIPRTYMSMRDYRNLPWQNQQPLGRNPNPSRSMRDYRDQWMSAPFYSVPPTYAPPASQYYAPTSQQ